jgi:hypothetical protein
MLSVLVGALCGVGPAVSAETDLQVVDLQLILAVDISASMSFDEQKIQRKGYVDALRDPTVIAAITSGPRGRVAVTYVEWAEFEYTAIQWTLLDSRQTAERFAGTLQRLPFHRERGTSISLALYYASALFDRGRFTSDRRTVDVSGDGPNNVGPLVTEIRDEVVARGITINGLPIVFEGNGSSAIDDLNLYYRSCVIGGPGAFTMPVKSADELAGAIRMKLLREILVSQDRSLIVHAAASRELEPVDCTKGRSGKN